MRPIKRLLPLLLLSFSHFLVPSLSAQTTLRVLAIGNSFSEDAVEQNLYELGHEVGYEFIIGNAYRGGQGLESHWNVVSKGETAFQYRKVTDGVRTNRKDMVLDRIIADEPWDIITLQQVSQDAGRYDTYDPYLQQLLQYVSQRATNKDVRYGFHQTWAYAANSSHKGFANYGNNQQAMYESIVAAVSRAMSDHSELVFCIPSGTAIQNARTTPLGDHLNRDGYHLDKAAGRYAAACTWLESLTGLSPVGLTYHPANISPTVASIVQQAAHDALMLPETVTPQTESFQFLDTCRISVFGSSIAHGTGATDNRGYAYLYGQQLLQRTQKGTSPYAFTLSDISVGGNTSAHLLNRYHDLIYDLGRYVVFGISLGNEGIHNSRHQQAITERWAANMQQLIAMAQADGKVPVVMNNYGRRDFNAKDYACVKKLNLQIHEWDVPSVNLLGAIDDREGHWPKGYENDAFHPNTLGHREMMYAIPPSLFDALANGKPVPVRDKSKTLTLARGNTLRFAPEGTLHPFAISITVKGSDRGRILTLNCKDRKAWIGVNRDHRVYYCSASGDSLVCPIPLEDKVRHTITLSHYYALRETLFYVDNEGGSTKERLQLESAVLGDSKNRSVRRHLSELFFWRSALNTDEIAALSRGAMLKSSLEIYVPMDDEDKENLANQAQSMNNSLRYVKASHSR